MIDILSDYFLNIITSFSFFINFQIVSKIRVKIYDIFILCALWIGFNHFIDYAGFIIAISYFYLIGKQRQNEINRRLLWFYSVYSVFVTSLIGYSILVFINFLIGDALIERYLLPIYLVVTPLFPAVINGLFIKLLQPNFDYLRQHSEELDQKFLIIINLILTVGCCLQFGSYWLEEFVFKDGNPIRGTMVIVFIFTIGALLKYLGIKIKELNELKLKEAKEKQLTDLTTYTQQIETIYQELRGFRHDYQNTLRSMAESIHTADVTIIEQTYNDILKRQGIILRDSKFNLVKLEKIHILPIKSILSNAAIRAFEAKIKVILDIEAVIETIYLDTLDLVRILAILLDNAIEATVQTAHPKLTIAYILDDEQKKQLLIIENTFEEKKLDGTRVNEAGYSTKGENRGMGLANVEQILRETKNAELLTEIYDDIFRQTLIMEAE